MKLPLKTFEAAVFALAVALLSPLNVAAENWLTFHYDNARDGANPNEVVLTPANVNVTHFFKLFTYTVDAEVYAEPLYMASVAIAGQGTHNVVFVATENDTVYAFDADSNTGANGGLLWHTNLGIAATSTEFGVRYHHNVLNPLIGITSTPVIDPVSGTIYVDGLSGDVSNTTNCLHRINALKISDGTEQPYSPVVVAASVPGTGVDSSNGVVAFRPNQHMNRPAMTLAGGKLFVGYGSYGDTDPFHGWVIGYNATNLVQLTNYVFLPALPTPRQMPLASTRGKARSGWVAMGFALMLAAIFILKPRTEVSAPTPTAGTTGIASSSYPLRTNWQWPIIFHPRTRSAWHSMIRISGRAGRCCWRIQREARRIRTRWLERARKAQFIWWTVITWGTIAPRQTVLSRH